MVELPRLFTSRWTSPLLRDLDAAYVGISRGVPRWPLPYRYKLLRSLAPSREAFAIKNRDEFSREYLGELAILGTDRIVADLAKIGREVGHKPLVLLCWEDVFDPEQWCHRRLLAGWLHEHLGVEVPELVAGALPRASLSDQATLF
jgi:Protein of unknown function, DUF488